MELIHTVDWMKQVARQARSEGAIVGLVPTMGALHAGHLSLVRAARERSSSLVVSIFVNPKQFGPKEDFTRYPRTLDADRAALDPLGVHHIFAPPVEEMYPRGFSTGVEVAGLSERLEGRSRPGHFRGVTTVVLKLFEIVQPSFAFFGRKDAQQGRIIRQMAADLNLDTEIVVCPIVREPDGLALSSRNSYLQAPERAAATVLSRSLAAVRQRIERGERMVQPLVEEMRAVLAAEPLAAVDYAEIVDADTFEPATRLHGSCLAVMAVFIGSTRLIDNMLIEADGAKITCTI
ncbi:MAG: pantoate--beta-alanine ligase [Acidobacteriota bacterium]|nr:pantoate--beta-alanine ligase [Acidobacteriota bacterium]